LILTTFIEIIGIKFPIIDDLNHVIFDFASMLERKNILTLIECLWDTYTNNKNLALQLLLKIEAKTFQKYVYKFIIHFMI
jgi:hypothetical protein